MDPIDAKIRLFLAERGYLFPETDAEIDAVKQQMNNENIELPPELQSPGLLMELLGSDSDASTSKIRLFSKDESHTTYDKDFSMAAREGGKDLPDDIKREIEDDIRQMDEKDEDE